MKCNLMAFPKKIKKHLPLTPDKILLEKREQLLEYIQERWYIFT